jgi:putative transposase
VLGVSDSGYYLWHNRPPSARAIRHAWLTEQIEAVHTVSNGVYGAHCVRRVHAELTLGHGIVVGHGAVEMLMRRAGLKGLPGSRRPRPKHQTPTAADLVGRAFSRTGRDQRWSIDASQTAALVTNDLDMAIRNRNPEPGLVIHSDHGVQFTSWAFTQRARASGLVPSMGSVADCDDNAMIESFWSRMQTELLNRRRSTTRIELANAIFEYLEIFHNRQRRHSALGMRTPIEYELRADRIDPVA